MNAQPPIDRAAFDRMMQADRERANHPSMALVINPRDYRAITLRDVPHETLMRRMWRRLREWLA